MTRILQAEVALNNGLKIPRLGLGVWKADNETTTKMVQTAIEHDYVLIDTARQYGNEAGVGQGLVAGLASTGRSRKDIFLTTKIFNGDQGDPQRVKDAFAHQLADLQTDYVDLLLLHWPVNDKYNQSWQALEDLYHEGKAKAIGVCNFDRERLSDLLDHATVTPAINQIEFNPLIHQPETVEFCRDHGIQVEAWSPLGNGRLLTNPVIQDIATAHHKSAAQVILRWVYQHKIIILSKTTHASRMVENAAITDFELSSAEMTTINSLDEEKHSIWYPTFKWSGNPDGIENHIATPDEFK